jgi:Fic family protein
MFNPNKPYNSLPELPPKFDFEDVELLKLVNKANIALSNLNGTSRLLPNRSILLAPLSVKEAVASSGIENINTTVAEVFEAELFPDKIQSGPQKETLHYVEALKEGYEMLNKKEILTSNMLIKIQKIIYENNSGIRKVPGTVIAKGGSQMEIIYTPPEGFEIISKKLANLEKYINTNSDDTDVLIKMAIAHYQFEAIHPFHDGNGRVGRILMILYLVLAQRLDLPILFLSGYILKNRAEYYKLLLGVTKDGNWKEFVKYILNGVIQQSDFTTEIIIKIEDEINRVKNLLSRKAPTISSIELIEFLFSNPFYTSKSIQEALDIHRNTASKYLSLLLDLKIIKEADSTKEKIYHNQKLLKLLEF